MGNTTYPEYFLRGLKLLDQKIMGLEYLRWKYIFLDFELKFSKISFLKVSEILSSEPSQFLKFSASEVLVSYKPVSYIKTCTCWPTMMIASRTVNSRKQPGSGHPSNRICPLPIREYRPGRPAAISNLKKKKSFLFFLFACLRDRSKFTGYLGWVLGKICLKKSLRAPFFSRKKVFAPLIFSEKKYSPPLFFVEKKSSPP